MSVWLESSPAAPELRGSEGALVSVSIDVDPRYLESLLEALSQATFPINPQIYHDAPVEYAYPSGVHKTETATLVEFPAYATRIDELRRVLEASGFDPASVQTTDLLEEMHAPMKRRAAV